MIYIIDLESVETRYTSQWKEHLPTLFKKEGFDVRTISGREDIPSATTPGAFLNFGGTNIYKANQVEKLGELFCNGDIRANDHFLFADAWHPGIINLKYMSELLGIPVKIHAMWHAGSYDPQDFLGRLIGDAPWVRFAEKSFFEAIDHNYFATEFHIDMFCKNLLNIGTSQTVEHYRDTGKIVRTGWPMEYMRDTLAPYKQVKKRDLILFPHRIAPEKQVEIFRDLSHYLPQYEFVICQEQQLTKHEYHTLLGEAKMVFSANLQETLGISWYEGALVGAIPVVPDRLSYSEMAIAPFKYPSKWTLTYNDFTQYRPDVMRMIIEHMENYESRLEKLNEQVKYLESDFFSATNMFEKIK